MPRPPSSCWTKAQPEKFDIAGVGEYEQPHCPKCGSMDISLDGLNKPVTFCRDVHYKRANSSDHSRLEMPFVWALVERRRRSGRLQSRPANQLTVQEYASR